MSYALTAELRLQKRIESKIKITKDAYLPLLNVYFFVVILYLVGLFILKFIICLLIYLDKDLRNCLKKNFCFWCCLLCGYSNFFHSKKNDKALSNINVIQSCDGDIESDSNDEYDSADELCCFQLTESIKSKRPVYIKSFLNKKARFYSGSSVISRLSSIKNPHSSFRISGSKVSFSFLNMNYKNFKYIDNNTLKIRLEFLTDLALFMDNFKYVGGKSGTAST